MHHISRRAVLAFVAASVAPIAAGASPAPRLVASFSVLADLARTVAGGRMAVAALVGPDADVHEFEPTPADGAEVARAAVVLRNGLHLEGWLPRLISASGFHGREIVAATGIPPRGEDPHAWQSVPAVRRYVANIRDGLAAADPQGAAAYAANAAAFDARLARLDADIRAALAPIPRRRRVIVTTHDAFGWYGADYGVDFLAPLGLSTDAEPSPKGMAQLVAQIRARGVRALFMEHLGNNALLRQVAAETGVRIGGDVYSDALSPPGGPAPDYEAMMRHNLAAFAKALA